MALNVLNLKSAIAANLASNTTLTEYIGHLKTDPNTGHPTIAIFKTEPSFPQLSRQVAFKVIATDPMVRDNPGSMFESQVYIYGAANQPEAADYIADLLTNWFSVTPEGENRNSWFRNLSTDCLTTKYVKYSGSVSSAKVTTTSNTDTDMWVSGIMVDIIWDSFGCTETPCTEVIPEHIELEINTSDLDINLDCCE